MKRLTLLVTLGMVVSLLVAACGGGDPTPTTPPAAAPQPTATPVPAAAPTDTPAPGQPTATPAPTTAAPAATPRATITPFPTATEVPKEQIQRGGVLVTALRDGTAGPSVQNALNNPALGPRHTWAGKKIFQGIMWNDPYDNHVLKPYMAESAEFNSTADEITFRVHPEAKWADGNSVTGQDFKFNIDAWMNPPEGFERTTAVTPIVTPIESVELVDAMTVKVILKAPSVSVLNTFGQYDALLVPSYRTFEESYTDPIGSGAFERINIETDVKYDFVKNPNYWIKGPEGEQLPYLDGMESIIFVDGSRVFAGLVTGQIDVAHGEWGGAVRTRRAEIDRRMPLAAKQDRYATANGWGFHNKAPFNDPRVTKAMNLVVDRLAFVELARGGEGTLDPSGVLYAHSKNGWALDSEEIMGTPGYRYVNKSTGEVELDEYKILELGSEVYEKDPRDIEAAKQLLIDAGLSPFPKFDLLSDNLYNEGNATVLVQLLKEFLDIDATLDIKDFVSAQEDRSSGNFTANQSWTYTPGFDPSNSLRWFTTNTHYHAHGYELPEWDALYAEQDQEVDAVKRKQLVDDMQRKYLEGEHPMIALAGTLGLNGLSREWVRNLPLPVISLTTVWYWDQTWIDDSKR